MTTASKTLDSTVWESLQASDLTLFNLPYRKTAGKHVKAGINALTIQHIQNSDKDHLDTDPDTITSFENRREVIKDLSDGQRSITLDRLDDIYIHFLFRPELCAKTIIFFTPDFEILDISTMGAPRALLERLVQTATPLERGALVADRFTGGNMAHVAFDHLTRALVSRTVLAPAPKPYFYSTTWDWARNLVNHMVPEAGWLQENVTYHFNELFLFSDAFNHRIFHPEIYYFPEVVPNLKAFRNSFCNKRSDLPLRVYQNRLNAKARPLRNERALVNLVQTHGFESIDFAQIPFAEQLELVFNAEHLIAPHGAGLTNLVAAREGLVVSELYNPTLNAGTRAYEMFCAAFDLDYRRIEIDGSESKEELEALIF